jgi:ABC-2 type transport system ATP-binding protein
MQVAILDGVTKSFGRTVALRSTSLVLRPGVVGLLGPNGAGKTTMLRLLATVMPPSSGRIVVVGHEVTNSHAARIEARRRIGYLPQEVVFPRGMTAFGFLDYVAVLKEWRHTEARHREVQRVLGLVQLDDKGAKKVSTLSGGQRRRLAIAQAMIGAPDLLILDEPTTGLDPEQRASLRGLLSGVAGTIRFDGTVSELLATAAGRVHAGPAPSRGAVTTWRTGTGQIRSVGGQPHPDAVPVEPSVEDAYLLLRCQLSTSEGVTS